MVNDIFLVFFQIMSKFKLEIFLFFIVIVLPLMPFAEGRNYKISFILA